MSARAAGVALVRLAEHPAGKAGHFTAVHAAVFVAMAWLSVEQTRAAPVCRKTLAAIAAAALCDRSTAARVIPALERHGVIVRGQHGPRQRVPWTLTPLTDERPDYGQSAYSSSRQSAYSDDAERLHRVGRARHGSIPVPSADVVPGAAAPLPPPPTVTGDEDHEPRVEWARLAAAVATPAQVAWAERYNATYDQTGMAEHWPPEWDADTVADVAFALAGVHGWP